VFIELSRYDRDCYSQDIETEVVTNLKARGKQRISKKHTSALVVICSNLVQIEDTGQALVIPLTDNYNIPVRYNSYGIYGRVLSEVLDSLHDTGWISLRKGSKNTSLTVVKPTSKFLKVFPFEPKYIKSHIEYVILKDKDKALKAYKDDKFTRMSRVILDRYNAVLANTLVTLDGVRIKNEYYRIFNEDFTKGGRYYRAGVLSLAGVNRVGLKIDESPVCEIDFSCMHVAILLGMKGLALDYNPYSFLANRQEAKKVMNIVLCSKTRVSAKQAIQSEINFGNMDATKSAEEVLKLAEEANLLIADKFYSGNGLEAMFAESEIATDIISSCLGMDVPVLVIHDGFVTQKKYSKFLTQVMLDAFTSHVGYDLPMYVAVTGVTEKEESWCVSFDTFVHTNSLPVSQVLKFNRRYDSKGNREYEM